MNENSSNIANSSLIKHRFNASEVSHTRKTKFGDERYVSGQRKFRVKLNNLISSRSYRRQEDINIDNEIWAISFGKFFRKTKKHEISFGWMTHEKILQIYGSTLQQQSFQELKFFR
jgi:hypothetical protein